MLKSVLKKIISSEGPLIVEYRGLNIPITYKKGNSNALIVLFHGVIRRDVRKFPCYEAFLPIDAHQISIADPALLENRKIVSSWYLGVEGKDQTDIISELVQGLNDLLACRRTIYLGGSAGGFAALLYSNLHDGSVAVAVSPQVKLQTYQNRYVEMFRTTCWPSSTSLDDLEFADLTKLYAKNFKNYVIYVMSAADFGHLYTQLIPFLGVIPMTMRERFVMDVGFFNVLGHPGSVPRSSYTSWVRAALISSKLSTDDLLKTHYKLTNRIPARPAPAEMKSVGYDPADISRADLLRNLELKY